MRQNFPAKVRAAVLRRCSDDKGIPHCEGCGAPGFVEIDHVKADGLDGPATIENAKALCKTCHGRKTHTHDRPIMAKADRQRKKHFLGRKPRTIRAWRRFNGEKVFAGRER